jgi:hypothetical protein
VRPHSFPPPSVACNLIAADQCVFPGAQERRYGPRMSWDLDAAEARELAEEYLAS